MEREEREGQAKGQACELVERQVKEIYIDEYEYCNDY
jgi:hypothetical protein